MDEAEAKTAFRQLTTLSALEDVLRIGLVILAQYGLATLADLELLDELENQSQHQPLAA